LSACLLSGKMGLLSTFRNSGRLHHHSQTPNSGDRCEIIHQNRCRRPVFGSFGHGLRHRRVRLQVRIRYGIRLVQVRRQKRPEKISYKIGVVGSPHLFSRKEKARLAGQREIKSKGSRERFKQLNQGKSKCDC